VRKAHREVLSRCRSSHYPGINDSLGSNPTGSPFASQAFTLFGPWTDLERDGDAFHAARERSPPVKRSLTHFR
jgi:hypothetical protein